MDIRSILTIAGMLLSFALFLVGQWWWRRKALSYTVSETQLLTVHGDLKGKVQILFDGVSVPNVSLVVIKVRNSGHEPIRANDFERPLRFDFGSGARILSLDADEANQKSLKPAVRQGAGNAPAENAFELDPLLLNRGDWIKVKALVSNVGTISVDGRIEGVRDIRPVTGDRSRLKWLEVALQLLAGAILVFLIEHNQTRWMEATMFSAALALYLLGRLIGNDYT
jgi:hypothetical protein